MKNVLINGGYLKQINILSNNFCRIDDKNNKFSNYQTCSDYILNFAGKLSKDYKKNSNSHIKK